MQAKVWAVGDCAGSPHFTHIAFDDYRIVTDNLAGGHRVTTGRQVSFCMFTDPELARIGLSETEAKQRGIPYRITKIPMIAVLRTRTLSETRGFLKALIDTDSDRILGFTALGVQGGETIAGASRDAGRNALYRATRHHIYTSHDVRRAHPALRGSPFEKMISEIMVVDLAVWGEDGGGGRESMHTRMEVASIRMKGHVLPPC